MDLLSTKEVAAYLGVNEKMVYTLISDKDLPATKVTGKWLFPREMVVRWVELHTINPPGPAPEGGMLTLAGSNDLLLDRAMGIYNERFPSQPAAHANLGSKGGLEALRKGLCHIASSHLMEEDGKEYNFSHVAKLMDRPPAVVSFCRREQGLILPPGNPRGVKSVADIGRQGLRIVNRSLSTGTRLLFERLLEDAGMDPEDVPGHDFVVPRHLDVGLAVLTGKADCGPAIRAVAGILGLDFLPLTWERFDLLISRDRFFSPSVQRFLNILQEPAFKEQVDGLQGYDVSSAGRMLFAGGDEDAPEDSQS